MAAYAVVDYVTDTDTLISVTATMETKLETLDSGTNVIRHIDVHQMPGGGFVGIIIYDG